MLRRFLVNGTPLSKTGPAPKNVLGEYPVLLDGIPFTAREAAHPPPPLSARVALDRKQTSLP